MGGRAEDERERRGQGNGREGGKRMEGNRNRKQELNIARITKKNMRALQKCRNTVKTS